MAFCTNCGKALEEGCRFCTNCGVPVSASMTPGPAQPSSTSTAAAPAPATQTPTPAADTAAILSTPPPEEVSSVPETSAFPDTQLPIAPQSSVSPFFVIICVILVLLIGAGIAGTVYLQKQRAPKAEAERSETTHQPAPVSASTSAPAATPAVPDSVRVLNLGNYPGATPVAIATLTADTVIAGFLTRDTPQQVMQFYKIRFPVSSELESEGKAQLSATLSGGEHIRIEAQPQSPNTQVVIFLER